MKTRHPAIMVLIGFLLGLGAIFWTGATLEDLSPSKFGRYQGVHSVDGGVYVVDTVTGKVMKQQ